MSPVAPDFGSMRAKKLKKMLCNQLGYVQTRRNGSHCTLKCEGRPTLIFAFHDGAEVGAAIVRNILVKQAGLSLQEAKEVYRDA